MKFLVFGFLLLVVKNSLAQDADIDLTSGLQPSEQCMAEINKYSGCTENLDINSIDSLESSESITKFCSAFNDDKCSALVNDSIKTDSACVSKDNTNIADQFSGLIYTTLKLTYSLYCSKGSDGKTCAFSQYITDNAAKIGNATDLDDAGKKALANDCRDKKCHDRLMSLKELSNYLDSMSDEKDTTSTDSTSSIDGSEVVDKYFEFYSKSECDKIDGSSSSSSSSSTSTSDASTILRFTLTAITMMIFSALMLI